MPLKDREKRLAYQRKKMAELRMTTYGRAYQLYNAAKHRAIRNKLKFDLSVEWIQEKVSEGFCQLSGIKFEFDKGGKRGGNPFAPSVDKIDAKGGYTKSNCQIVLWGINNSKGEMSTEEFKKFLKLIWEGINETAS